MQKADGMFYAPKGKSAPVCEPGEFPVAAVGLDHGHIYGMTNGLLEAGAELRWVYDPDPAKVKRFREAFPGAAAAESEEQVLQDPDLRLVAGACIPSERAALGVRVLEHGKHYFADKPPLTSLEQLKETRRVVAATGRKYMVYYAERLHSESAVHAGRLIAEGAIGRVVQVIGLGPHRINLPSRPDWFFRHEQYGGILCDIGSHQIEQFLSFSGARDAKVLASKVANYNHKEYPELEDFGDATLLADNGASCYFRVDWFTPDGLGAWGDGRTFILGTEGYMELRKYLDVGRDNEGDQVYLVDHKGEKHIRTAGKEGFPFFGQLIRDCLDGTETAMTQEHAFKAAELSIKAQLAAQRVE
jgi:predicted dehydrogenase